MDFLPDLPTLSEWLVQYGSLFLFLLMALGIIIFPVPEETLMVVAGALMRHEKLSIPGTIIAACTGSICGISMSYLIGRSFGSFLIDKYGKWFGITHKRLEKAHVWFERFGKWTLFIGYFIPGIRHFTGLSAGITKLHYKQFAFFAYTGAVIWVSIFLSFGYFFGPMGLELYEKLEFTADEIILIVLIAISVILIGLATYHFVKKSKKRPPKT
jgi:membrane protein DedA with SNARE-associated domain